MPRRTRSQVLLAKIESTYGTDPTPTGSANAILCSPVSLVPLQAEAIERNNVQAHFGSRPRILTGEHVGIEFEVEIAGSGAAGTAPAYGPLLEACGMSPTNTPGVSEVYNPITGSELGCTIYANLDGTLHEINGWRGAVTFRYRANQIPTMQFRGIGIYVAPVAASLPTADYSGFVDPLHPNSTNTPTATIHGHSAAAEEIEIVYGSVVNWRDLVGGSPEAFIADRQVTGRMVIEAPAIGTKDFFAAAKAETLAALEWIHGTAAGNIVEHDAPKVQIMNPTYGDSDGALMLNLDLVFTPNTGNDEHVLTVR